MQSKYKITWSIIYWDAPNDTLEARRALRRYSKAVSKIATAMGSKSHRGHGWSFALGSPDMVEAKLLPFLPLDGELRVIGITDAQYGKCKIHWGGKRKRN